MNIIKKKRPEVSYSKIQLNDDRWRRSGQV